METQKPAPQSAREALDLAEAEEAATRHRPVPAWYMPVLAVIVFVLFGLNAIEHPGPAVRVAVIVTAMALAMTVGALFAIVSVNPRGYRGIRVQWRPALLTGGLAALFIVGAFVLAPVLGSWVWLMFGGALAVLFVIAGILLQRSQRRG